MMRKQFVTTVENLLEKNEKIVLLLGDIGVWGFRNSFKNYPKRVINIGILEQSTISGAAGLAMSGLTPIVHTIAPFLVERAYEQLKDDFGYQHLHGNFVGVGASFDYASLGGTHHCPSDVAILKQIPNMQIVVPGHSSEFDQLFQASYNNSFPTYFRLSEQENNSAQKVSFGKAKVIKKGSLATIIAIGPMLDAVVEAAKNLDVTILYYTTLKPFDHQTLRKNVSSGKILLCEPFFQGTMSAEILNSFPKKAIMLQLLGVPHLFLKNYGKVEDHKKDFGHHPAAIKKAVRQLIKK